MADTLVLKNRVHKHVKGCELCSHNIVTIGSDDGDLAMSHLDYGAMCDEAKELMDAYLDAVYA